MLAACSVLDRSVPTPAPPTSTVIPSPTIDWFPASPTPTLQVLATQQATPEILPQAGGTILTDRFTSSSLWDVGATDAGSASLDRNQLTLAAKPGEYMVSLRGDPVLGNFYAEVTARPSLCRGTDDYGLLVRATSVAYYRFALACDGTVRAERAVYTRIAEEHALQEPVPSGDAPPGAPGQVRIGVWAAGNEMRLFLNERFQFAVMDANYSSGLIGLFARSTGETAVTVSFSELVVREVNEAWTGGAAAR
jgi:hypothetical protein